MTGTPERTQDRMWHDVLLPEDVEHVRPMARAAVEKHLAPVAREIGQRPDASSDLTPSMLKTVARRTADGFVVDGRKR